MGRSIPADGRPMDPNDPMAMAPRPPGGWEAMLRGLHGVVGFFSRVSFLVDENTHAVHFFISALLQMLDRCSSTDTPPLPTLHELCVHPHALQALVLKHDSAGYHRSHTLKHT